MIGKAAICIDKTKSIKKTAKKVVIWLIIKKKFRYLHLNFFREDFGQRNSLKKMSQKLNNNNKYQ